MSKVKNKVSGIKKDGVDAKGGAWLYSGEVKKHFFNPKNFVVNPEGPKDYNGLGMVGSPACGDMMKVWVKVDRKKDKVVKMKWQTFGCASAIAATSMLSVIVTEKGGMLTEKAMKIKPQDITDRLGGLPNRKIHCSVLGDKALRSAINDYYLKSGQAERVVGEKSRIIDEKAKVSDRDIERAVLEGATTLSEVQKKTKVGVGNPAVIPEVEELIKFYRDQIK